MRDEGGFRRNLAIIGIVHVVVLTAVVRWNAAPAKAAPSNILWMDGSVGLPSAETVLASETMIVPEPTAEPTASAIEPAAPEDEGDGQAADESMESEMKITTPTPRPKPVVTPRRVATPTPKKIVVAKTSATPRPKPATTPLVKKSPDEPPKTEASPSPTASTDVTSAIAAAAKTGTETTAGISGTGAGGAGGRGVGPGGASQFGWYAHMLHDRFFSQWAQPTSVVRSGAKMSTLVKLRIEKDGTVSRFTILKPSGNVVVDDSVAAVSKRVTQVDPLPSGLGDGFYEVNINFELNSDQ